MLSREEALRFANDWIEAWNSHSIDRILSHYSNDFEMTTPFIVKVMNNPTGTINGKQNVRAYWENALQRVPDLHFELIDVFTSVKSITIYYKAVMGKLAAEVLFFNDKGLVEKGIAHYNQI